MEGLHWGASKLVPVGYGIKKLQIMLTIVDDLVSVDNLIEEHLMAEPINEYVQSCDIVPFNKICIIQESLMTDASEVSGGSYWLVGHCKVTTILFFAFASIIKFVLGEWCVLLQCLQWSI
ncbi:hypothetical protein AB3S75_017219 [Citrus x aurantiifolia]